jgi:membrane protease YdiL (CAAX protease family)
MLAQTLTIALVFLLLGVVPVLASLTARKPELRAIPRIDLYVSAVLSQWLLAVLALGVIWLAGPGFPAVGFRPVPQDRFLVWSAGLAGGTLAGLGLVIALERLGLWPEESDLVRVLIPRTRLERLLAVVLVAPTAAFCEELLYRGFLFAQLVKWTDSVPWALVISSAGFGLAHAYQGIHGMMRTALLGALLTVPLIRTGSLYPSMAAHFVIDAVALAWLGPRFLRSEPPAQP